MKIEDRFLVTFCVLGFDSAVEVFKFKDFFPKDVSYAISMHYIKQSSIDVLRKISKKILANEAELKDSKSSVVDIDILTKVKDDAKNLRYDMQINNEEVYKMYLFVKIESKDKEEVLRKAQRFKASLITKGLRVNTLNFRHLYGFLATMPFGYSGEKIFKDYYMNLTTTNICTLFPFYTNVIFEKNGILIGRVKNSSEVCMFDMFNQAHLNSNICIFGSSGSGKSYFTKLLILRNYLKNIKQYIIDPEGEYGCLPGEIFNVKNSKINLLEIFEEDIKDNFLNAKIEKVAEIICNICNLREDFDILKELIKKEYNLRNITNDLNSIYTQNEAIIDKKIINKDRFPTISDVIVSIEVNKEIKKKHKEKIIRALKDKFEKSYSFLNGITTVDMNSNIIVFNILDVNSEDKSMISEIVLGIITNKIKKNYRSLIYIDEVWKLIYKNERLSNIIFDLYKTVRKKNAGIITITQDVSDFFSKDTGGYGKSIFNNSYIKVFFKIDYQESQMLKNMGIINEEEYVDMIKMNKGEMNMYINSEAVKVKIEANEYEKSIIERSDKFDYCRTR